MRNFYFILLSLFVLISCSDENDCCPNEPADDNVAIPLSVYEKVYGVTSQIYIQGNYVYINTNGIPDHKSPYFPLDHVLYEAYDGSNPFVNNWKKNPNGITTLNLRLNFLLDPQKLHLQHPHQWGQLECL